MKRASLRFSMCLLLAAPSLAGQTSDTYQPAAIRFEPGGVGLLEAVRLTLENSPNIKLQAAETLFQQGVAQSATGLFDTRLLGNFAYEWRERELPESTKDDERMRRSDLEADIVTRQGIQNDTIALRDALVGVLEGGLMPEDVPDAEIRARLVLVDTLIDTIPDPTAQQRLRDVRDSFLTEQIDDALSEIQGNDDALAGLQQELANIGPSPDEEITQQASIDLRVTKLLRNGIEVSPFFDGKFDSIKFKGKPVEEEFGGLGAEDLYDFRIGFAVVVPLARNLGADTVAAGERAARLDHDASLQLLQFEASASVLDTAIAYWALRATQDRVEALTRSVELQEQLVRLTQAQIDAGELAPVEISRVRASESRSRARLENILQSLYEARVNLALVMGISVTGEDETLPISKDPFPDIPEPLRLDDTQIAMLADDAMDLRRDLQATFFLQEADLVLERGAELDTKPRIDLAASAWASAFGETTLGNATDRWVGPSFTISVELEKPLGNNFFQGLLISRRADVRRSAIANADLERVIRLSIARTAVTLLDAAERRRQAQDSVDFYQNTIDAEIQRFQAGDSTLVDTILTEDQQTGARLALAAAQQEFAQLLAELRFETGRLVTHGDGRSEITEEQLVSLPSRGSR